MTKSDARAKLNEILADVIKARQGEVDSNMSLQQFIEQAYFPLYERKWKRSTAACNINRVNTHIVATFGEQLVKDIRRDDLQPFLDGKCAAGLSFSVVDHLRWDLKQIFGMAVAEGVLGRSPAVMIFTPSGSKRVQRLVMNIEEVKRCFAVLDLRERLIVQMAILAGMRPGEIFGLTWQHLGADHVDIRQRV
jgi:integrase